MTCQADEVLQFQARVLEKIALGAGLKETLDELCRLVEGMVPGSICSTMLLDKQGTLQVESAPRALPALVEALNGLVPSDMAGSCGTAVFQRAPVYVQDAARDRRWMHHREISRKFGLRACWSVPIITGITGQETVRGSFAISHTEKRKPTPFHKQILKTAGHLAGITIERGLAEHELRASEQKYQDLYDNAPDMFFSAEAAGGRIVECNQTLVNALGQAKEQILGSRFVDIYDPACRHIAEDAFRRFVKTGEVQVDGLRLVSNDGRKIDVSLKGSAVRDEQGNVQYTRSVLRDVTEQKQSKEMIQRTQKLESLGVLAGGIAHDFNNLLVGIMGNIQLAMLEVDGGSQAMSLLRDAEAASQRAGDLINQLLAYAGKGHLHVKTVDLSAVIRDTARLLRSSVPRKTVIEYEYAADPLWISADVSQIHQVGMNLVTNAGEAVGNTAGSVIVRTGVMFADADYLQRCYAGNSPLAGHYNYIEVQDTGCGMDDATVEKVFDPFFTTKNGGRGLGLATTLGIVKAHGGAINIISAPKRGATIRVLFPLADAPTRVDDHCGPDARPEAGKATILVVDDEEMVVDITARLLAKCGHRVVTAGDGTEALQVVRQRGKELDAIVLDMTMPGMDGEEIFSAIRAIRADLPVVFCSGHGTVAGKSVIRDKDFAAFLAKPFSSSQLCDALAEALGTPC